MIERFGNAIGIRIPVWKNIQAELWFCPRAAVIPPHIHKTIDSFIIYVIGKMRVTCDGSTRVVSGPMRKRQTTGKWRWATKYIPAGVSHCAEVLGPFAIFLNVERCHSGFVSASKDYYPI